MNPIPQRAEVAIVGGGPIGIELAVGFRHAGVPFAHIEAGTIGSTMMWWAPGTRFFSSPERIEIAGVPMALTHQEKASREEYLAYLRCVVRQFDLKMTSFTRVMRIDRTDDEFELTLRPSAHGVGGPQGQRDPEISGATDAVTSTVRARRIVLAIGNMHRPRLLKVPGEDLPHVSHFLDEPHAYVGRRVLIVGGKNSAVEAALRLHRAGVQVAMSYRGSEFDPNRVKYWLRPELEWLIDKKRIEFHPRTVVGRICADHVALATAGHGGASTTLPADIVLALTGYVQDPLLFNQLGIELAGDEQAPCFDPQTMQTNVAGAYVAGTAAGGSQQRARLFIENTHVHVRRIVRAIANADVPWKPITESDVLEQ